MSGANAGRSLATMTGLEIFDRIAFGRTVFHRDDDAWDLLDEDGLVAAVICPRKSHVSIAPVEPRVSPKPVGRKMPYGEIVTEKITADQIERGTEILARLAQSWAT
jgi:hypothetical protein